MVDLILCLTTSGCCLECGFSVAGFTGRCVASEGMVGGVVGGVPGEACFMACFSFVCLSGIGGGGPDGLNTLPESLDRLLGNIFSDGDWVSPSMEFALLWLSSEVVVMVEVFLLFSSSSVSLPSASPPSILH